MTQKNVHDEYKERMDTGWAKMFEEIAALGWETFPLWRDGAPNFHPEYGQVQPRITLLPKQPQPRGMVIVCAGGGFRFKSPHEAKPVAERFHSFGLNAAILDYRVQPYAREDALEDAKRAIRFLRFKAEAYHILPDKIAILGFSAGGILSGMAATKFDYGDPDAACPIERFSCRPDAAVLCYGAMSRASRYGDLQYHPEEHVENARYSTDKNLREDCPPFFLFQTAWDDPRHSLILGKELADRGLPFEVHIFKEGQHGYGLYDGKNDVIDVPHTAHWSGLAAEWLIEYGF